MTHCAGIDVSLETSSICIVDAQGLIQREFKMESEPEAIPEPRTRPPRSHPQPRAPR